MSKTPKIAFIHNSLISETKLKVEELIDELELKEVSWTSSAGDDLTGMDTTPVSSGDFSSFANLTELPP